jgi:hypothetical protein
MVAARLTIDQEAVECLRACQRSSVSSGLQHILPKFRFALRNCHHSCAHVCICMEPRTRMSQHACMMMMSVSPKAKSIRSWYTYYCDVVESASERRGADGIDTRACMHEWQLA